MRDKQIMIDGVDVSKCRYFLKDTEGQDYNTDEFVKGCCEAKGSCIGYEFAGYGLCRGDKDCYFKQLARKTRECEELKKQLMQKSEVDIFFNTPIEGWSSDPCGICKYKNCLTEIKKIAEPFCNACQEFEPEKKGSNCMYCNYGKILQKISECEVNND